MLYISHRGYIEGPDTKLENNPENLSKLISKNIHIEVDVRYYKKSFYLGHDEPKYKIDKKFLEQANLWCHAKDFQTLDKIRSVKCHYFCHQNDDYTLTSKGYIWVYPGKTLIKNCIAVLPENYDQDLSKCYGMCTDNIKNYLKNL